jgi:CTP:molybdopterin cytidylyltransferase MocA
MKNGMFSSYKKGIYSIYNIFGNKKNFTKLNRAIIISLADMPLISSTIVLKLIDKLDSKFVDYAVPYFIDVNKIQQDYSKKNPIKTGGKKGHPIALKPSFASKILKFDDKVILRDTLKIGKYKLLKTEENGVLLDIDIKDDIKKVESILKQEPKSYGK